MKIEKLFRGYKISLEGIVKEKKIICYISCKILIILPILITTVNLWKKNWKVSWWCLIFVYWCGKVNQMIMTNNKWLMIMTKNKWLNY